jgi:hypothetical protein
MFFPSRFLRLGVFLPGSILVLSCGGGGGGSAASNASPPPAPIATITAPTYVGVAQKDCAASVPAQTGCTFAWTISNGTITGGAGTNAIAFLAGSQGQTQVSCSVTNAAGTVASGNFQIAVYAVGGPIFSATSVATPDVSSYFNALGSGNLNITTVAVADLTLSGRQDIILQLSMSQSVVGQIVTTPTPNRLIVLLQQADGSYVDGTLQLFGTQDVDLGGVARMVAVGDLNGDGYPDFIFATNNEDGRAAATQAESYYNYAKPAAVISNGDGTYRVENQFGVPSWGATVGFAANNVGGLDAIWVGNGAGIMNSDGSITYSSPTQAFRMSGTQWSPVSIYPSFSGTFLFLPPNQSGLPSTQMVCEYYDATVGEAMQLWTLQTGPSWLQSSQFAIPIVQMIPWVSWQGASSTQPMYFYDGMYLGGGGFMDAQVFQQTAGATPNIICKFGTAWIVNGYTGSPVQEGVDTKAAQILYEFSLNGNTLAQANLSITGEDIVEGWNFFETKDLRGSGYDDIIVYVYRQGGLPDIYLNDGNGNLAAMDTSSFPTAPVSWGSNVAAKLIGTSQPGIYNLFFFPNGFTWADSGPFYLPLYQGLLPLHQP